MNHPVNKTLFLFCDAASLCLLFHKHGFVMIGPNHDAHFLTSEYVLNDYRDDYM